MPFNPDDKPLVLDGQPVASFDPATFVDGDGDGGDTADPGSLLRLLAQGEDCEDLVGTDSDDPPFRVIRVLVGVDAAIRENARGGVSRKKSLVHKIATKLGLAMLREYPEWPLLNTRFIHLNLQGKAKNRDRGTVAFLEARTGFTWAHSTDLQIKTFCYPWVLSQINDSAEILGISKTQALVTCLALGLSTLPDWEGFFDEDIERLNAHIVRRLRVLDVDA